MTAWIQNLLKTTHSHPLEPWNVESKKVRKLKNQDLAFLKNIDPDTYLQQCDMQMTTKASQLKVIQRGQSPEKSRLWALKQTANYWFTLDIVKIWWCHGQPWILVISELKLVKHHRLSHNDDVEGIHETELLCLVVGHITSPAWHKIRYSLSSLLTSSTAWCCFHTLSL
jgi:hypothetical protein